MNAEEYAARQKHFPETLTHQEFLEKIDQAHAIYAWRSDNLRTWIPVSFGWTKALIPEHGEYPQCAYKPDTFSFVHEPWYPDRPHASTAFFGRPYHIETYRIADRSYTYYIMAVQADDPISHTVIDPAPAPIPKNEPTHIKISDEEFLTMWQSADRAYVWINYGGGSTWTHASERMTRVVRWITNTECEWEFTNRTYGMELDELIRAKHISKDYSRFLSIQHWMPKLPDDRLTYTAYSILMQESTRYILIGQPV